MTCLVSSCWLLAAHRYLFINPLLEVKSCNKMEIQWQDIANGKTPFKHSKLFKSYFIYQRTRAGQQLAKCETAKVIDAVVFLQADVL